MSRLESILQWIILLLVPIMFGFMAIQMGQDINWDLQNYHLYNAYAFLNNRINFDMAPAGCQTYLNPYLDIVYFLGIQRLHPWVMGFIIGAIQGINFILVFFVARYCLKAINIPGAIWAMILALLGIFSIGFMSEVGTVFWDSVVSLFPLVSLLMILAGMNDLISGKKYAFVLVAGLVAGIGAGLKLVVIVNALALGFAFLWVPVDWKRRLWLALIFSLAVGVGVMGTDGFWLWEIWHKLGNPIFPMMNNVFHSALGTAVPFRDVRFLPNNFWETLFFPVVFTLNPFHVGELPYRQIAFLVVYFVSAGFLAYKGFYWIGKKPTVSLKPEIKYLFLFFWLSFTLWLATFCIYRYLITIEILIPLVLFVLFLSLFKSRPLTKVIVLLLLWVVTIVDIPGTPDWGHVPWGRKVFEFHAGCLRQKPVDAVVLIDQPLGWLIPAIDMKMPFVQVMNNFPVSQTYIERAKSLFKNAPHHRIFMVCNPWVTSSEDVSSHLRSYDLDFKIKQCLWQPGYLGAVRIWYLFCPVNYKERK